MASPVRILVFVLLDLERRILMPTKPSDHRESRWWTARSGAQQPERISMFANDRDRFECPRSSRKSPSALTPPARDISLVDLQILLSATTLGRSALVSSDALQLLQPQGLSGGPGCFRVLSCLVLFERLFLSVTCLLSAVVVVLFFFFLLTRRSVSLPFSPARLPAERGGFLTDERRDSSRTSRQLGPSAHHPVFIRADPWLGCRR